MQVLGPALLFTSKSLPLFPQYVSPPHPGILLIFLRIS